MTLRENLDPENQFTNIAIFEAIDACHCSDFVSYPFGLNTVVDDKSSASFSIGVLQLLCLVRAVLQKRKVF